MLNEVLRGGGGGGLGPAVTCNCLGRGRGGAGGQGWKVASCWLSVTRRDTWHVTLTTADGRQCVVTSYCKLLSSLSQSFTPPPVYTRRNIYNGHHSHFVITSYKIYAAIEMFNKRIVWWSLVKYNINNWPSTFCLFTFNIYFIVCVDNIYLMLSEVEVCYFLCPVCMNECIEQHPVACGQPPQCTQSSEYGPAAHLSLLSPRHSPPLSSTLHFCGPSPRPGRRSTRCRVCFLQIYGFFSRFTGPKNSKFSSLSKYLQPVLCVYLNKVLWNIVYENIL